jgi:putative molybdopterin biosynthesis protein
MTGLPFPAGARKVSAVGRASGMRGETDRADAELLTTREVAALLRIKERKVYDLVASGEIPHVRVTGKLLFPRALLDAWLGRHGGHDRSTPRVWPNIVAGSHDPLLDWALRESGAGLATFFDGSLDGLERLAQGDALMAGLHLVEGDGWNVAHIERRLGGEPVVLIEWARREQGLILPPGNPAGISGPRDLQGRRLIPRQREAGGFLLLQHLLEGEGLSLDAVDLLAPPARTEADVAIAIADGKAEVGLGLAAMARQFRLDFLPLVRERYDLVIWRRAFFEPPLQRLWAFCRSAPFPAKARDLGGYDIKGFGRVRYNGP